MCFKKTILKGEMIMSGNIQQFNVTCKNCGSKNVTLSGYCGQNTGFGYLNCQECPNEEESKDN
jgi:hypothetical protein